MLGCNLLCSILSAQKLIHLLKQFFNELSTFQKLAKVAIKKIFIKIKVPPHLGKVSSFDETFIKLNLYI